MGFFVLLLVFCLLAAAGHYGKPWVDRQLLMHRDHPKKREEETAASCDDTDVEIVVQDAATTRQTDSEAARRSSAPAASALPARLARQQLGSPLGPMEASIRTALRELRSRQVVKAICSKFESRMKSGQHSDERGSNEASGDSCDVCAVQYQPLLPRQEGSKPVEKPVEKPQAHVASTQPAPRHSIGGGGAAPMQRSNNLNAFLRRYSSNLEKAVMATQTATADNTERVQVTEEPPMTTITSIASQPAMMTPCDADSDLDDDYDDLKLEETLNKGADAAGRGPMPLLNLRLDLDPIAAISHDDDFSNQCDSQDDSDVVDEETGDDADKQEQADVPEASKPGGNNSSGSSSPRSRLANWTASRIPAPSATRSLSRSSFTTGASAQKKLQTPEKAARSVARLEQFRQQVPLNVHARLLES